MMVRVATNADIEEIAALCIQQIQAMAALQPYFYQEGPQSKAFIQSIIDDDTSDILIYGTEKEVEGFVLLQAKETSDFPFMVRHKFAYLMDIIVTENSKGKGFGNALLDAAKKWASARNLEYIELDVLSNNEHAIRFYNNHNFTDKRNTMFCVL